MKKLVFGLIATVLFSFNTFSQTEKKVFLGTFSVHAYLNDEGSNGCYSVLVIVTYTYEGTETVLAQSNVCVGNCGKFAANNENEKCPDLEFKGDYFYNTKYITKNCIVDLLQTESIYELYSQEKERVLSQIKN